MANDIPPKTDMLRVSLHEHEVRELMQRYPKITRTEICDIITTKGPMRSAVEAELGRLSAAKR